MKGLRQNTTKLNDISLGKIRVELGLFWSKAVYTSKSMHDLIVALSNVQSRRGTKLLAQGIVFEDMYFNNTM